MTVPVIAKGKTDIRAAFGCMCATVDRSRVTIRPLALFHYSRDGRGEHSREHLAFWSGILQADGYGGYAELYRECRLPGPGSGARTGRASRMPGASSLNSPIVEGAARKRSRGERA